MRFAHLSDLHLGKRLYELSLLGDQAHILHQITALLARERPDAVFIAGDVYDRGVPPTEAVQLFDTFLTELAGLGTQVFVISGNHDSAERLSFGHRLMEAEGVHIAPVFDGALVPVTLRDEWGEVDVYLLPFLRASQVRRFYPQEEIADTQDALRTVLGGTPLALGRRHVLLAHQFVVGAERSESEESSVGGLDGVDAALFDAFDYVALGHLHKAQSVGRGAVHYCGTPLAYSFAEAGDEKALTMGEMDGTGAVTLSRRPLAPLHALREVRGRWDEVTLWENYIHSNTEDYLRVVLTDEEDVLDAMGKLRSIYPNILRLDYDNRRTRSLQAVEAADAPENKTPLALFEELYERQNNQKLSVEQREFLSERIRDIWEEMP